MITIILILTTVLIGAVLARVDHLVKKKRDEESIWFFVAISCSAQEYKRVQELLPCDVSHVWAEGVLGIGFVKSRKEAQEFADKIWEKCPQRILSYNQWYVSE